MIKMLQQSSHLQSSRDHFGNRASRMQGSSAYAISLTWCLPASHRPTEQAASRHTSQNSKNFDPGLLLPRPHYHHNASDLFMQQLRIRSLWTRSQPSCAYDARLGHMYVCTYNTYIVIFDGRKDTSLSILVCIEYL